MIYNSCMQVLAPLYGIYMYLPNSFYHQYAIKMPSIWTISALFQMAPHRQPRLNLSKPNLGTARGVLASLSQVAEPSLGDAMGKRKTWGNKLGKKYGKHTLMIQSHWSLQIAKKKAFAFESVGSQLVFSVFFPIRRAFSRPSFGLAASGPLLKWCSWDMLRSNKINKFDLNIEFFHGITWLKMD